jgi:high-affinity nickel permease
MTKRDEKAILEKVISMLDKEFSIPFFVLITLAASVSILQMQDILSDRVKAHACEDAEELLLRYQVVQRAMEQNFASLSDEWYIDL